MRFTTPAIALMTLLALPATGSADAISDCNGDQPATVIQGCSQIIDGGKASDEAMAIAYFNRGNAYDDSGDHDGAIADYTAAIKLKPDFADSYFNRGFAYEDKQDYDSAIADYTALIKLSPDYAKAYYGRGRANEAKGDLKQALVDYQQAARLAPGNGTVLKKIAEVQQKLDQ